MWHGKLAFRAYNLVCVARVVFGHRSSVSLSVEGDSELMPIRGEDSVDDGVVSVSGLGHRIKRLRFGLVMWWVWFASISREILYLRKVSRLAKQALPQWQHLGEIPRNNSEVS